MACAQEHTWGQVANSLPLDELLWALPSQPLQLPDDVATVTSSARRALQAARRGTASSPLCFSP